MNTKPLTTLQAIKAKCIDCSGGDRAEVRRCELVRCALHPFRLGKNPYLSAAAKGRPAPASFNSGRFLPGRTPAFGASDVRPHPEATPNADAKEPATGEALDETRETEAASR